MLDPPDQSDMVLGEDRGPLHGGAVQCLAGPAVADLGIHRIGADLVADRAAMAARAVTRDERIVVDCGVVGAEVVHRNPQAEQARVVAGAAIIGPVGLVTLVIKAALAAGRKDGNHLAIPAVHGGLVKTS